jgi:hypothetical protein
MTPEDGCAQEDYCRGVHAGAFTQDRVSGRAGRGVAGALAWQSDMFKVSSPIKHIILRDTPGIGSCR